MGAEIVRGTEATEQGADEEREKAKQGGQNSELPETASAEGVSDCGPSKVHG